MNYFEEARYLLYCISRAMKVRGKEEVRWIKGKINAWEAIKIWLKKIKKQVWVWTWFRRIWVRGEWSSHIWRKMIKAGRLRENYWRTN